MAKRKSKPRVKGILGKLLSFFRGGKGGAKPRGLSSTFIFGGLLAIVTALFSIKLTLARRKVAKLQHKIDVQKEHEEHAKIIKRDATQAEVKKRISESIQHGKAKVRELRDEIAVSKAEAKAFEASLKEAQVWSDIKITK